MVLADSSEDLTSQIFGETRYKCPVFVTVYVVPAYIAAIGPLAMRWQDAVDGLSNERRKDS